MVALLLLIVLKLSAIIVGPKWVTGVREDNKSVTANNKNTPQPHSDPDCGPEAGWDSHLMREGLWSQRTLVHVLCWVSVAWSHGHRALWPRVAVIRENKYMRWLKFHGWEQLHGFSTWPGWSSTPSTPPVLTIKVLSQREQGDRLSQWFGCYDSFMTSLLMLLLPWKDFFVFLYWRI